MKTSHIVGISAVAVIVVLVIIGYYAVVQMGEFFEETYLEAAEYAENASKDQCLEKYVEDYKACDGVTCFGKTTTFGVMCLMQAEGDVEEFCADKPKSESEVKGSEWNENYCKPRGLDDLDCVNVYKVVETVCTTEE
jgi:hypothetical protein